MSGWGDREVDYMLQQGADDTDHWYRTRYDDAERRPAPRRVAEPEPEPVDVLVGHCINFETGQPNNCGCGSCQVADFLGLAVGETRRVSRETWAELING